MFKKFLVLALNFIVSTSYAEQPKSFEIHNTKIDKSVERCPKSELEIAAEALELELSGMRYLQSKPSCFEGVSAKFIHTSKNPDEAVDKLVSVIEGSEKIESLEYDKKFFSYKAVFSVKDTSGNKIQDSFSFMTSAKPGAKKPKRGCAMISANPSKAFVKQACL